VQEKLKCSGDSDFACRLRAAQDVFRESRKPEAENVSETEDFNGDSSDESESAAASSTGLGGAQGQPAGGFLV
jgi:hypothetical protein